MRMGWTRKWLCLACVGLPLVLATAELGQTAVGADRRGAGSIVDRVRRENDPELTELIRIATANHTEASPKELLEIVRRVTQGYAQVKLLDQQIAQINQKIEATTGPAEMRYEMVLAKSELEAKRMTELANLREALGIIPRLPFEAQPTQSLNAWVNLQPVEQGVVVLDGVKPFMDYWAMRRFKSVGMLSEREALDYVQGRLKDKNSLPVRVEISYKAEATSAARGLREKIMSLARAANADMDTEVRLELATWVGSGESPFFVQDGKITTLYPAAVKRPDGGSRLLTNGVVDPNDLDQCIVWRLTMPSDVPLRFRIEYDEASVRLAKHVADTVKAVAKRLGLSELVEATGTLVEAIPERALLGRWQAIRQAEMQTIEIQPGGVCQVTMGRGTEAIKAGANTSGTWMPAAGKIFIDIGDKGSNYCLYSAFINEQGYLVVNRGVVWPQGSFHLQGPSESIFRKAY
jgi:hypothetical protein